MHPVAKNGRVTDQSHDETPIDSLGSDLRIVVNFIREAIRSENAVLRPDGDTRADSFALAGLAHCCVLLEELDHLRASDNDLVAVLVGRALLETWLTAAWIYLGRENSLDILQGSYRKNLRTMDEGLEASIERAKRRQAEAQTRHDQAVEANKKIEARNKARGTAVPLRPVPQVFEVNDLDLDTTGHQRVVGGVPESSITFETMSQRIGPWAEQKGLGGGDWEILYHFLYRLFSTWGAHPTYWLFNEYFGTDTWLTHVRERPEPDRRSHAVTQGTVELTAMLSAEVFQSLGFDVSPLRDLVERYRQLALKRKASGAR